LSKFIITDLDEGHLDRCIQNLGAVSFPASKAKVAKMDWSKTLSKSLEKQLNFIIGCDCTDHSSIDPLAHLVEFSLNPEDGTFVHIGPASESVHNLQRKLGSKPNMKAKSTEIILEKIDLFPIVLENLEDVENQMNNEIEAGGYVEFRSALSSRHAVLVAGSHDDNNYKSELRAGQEREEMEKLAQKAEEEARIKAEFDALPIPPIDIFGWAAKESTNKDAPTRKYVDSSQTKKGNKSYISNYQVPFDERVGGNPDKTGSWNAKKLDNKDVPQQNHVVDPTKKITMTDTSYLEQLSGGFSAGKSAPAPNSNANIGGPHSYLDELSSGITFMQSQSYPIASAPQAAIAVSPVMPAVATSTSIGQNLGIKKSLAETDLRAIEKSVELKIEKVVEAVVEASVEVAVEPSCEETARMASNVSKAVHQSAVHQSGATTTIPSTATTMTTTTTASSETFSSQANASLRQSTSPPDSLADAELRKLEKLMESEVESFAESSGDLEYEQSSETIVEGLRYPYK